MACTRTKPFNTRIIGLSRTAYVRIARGGRFSAKLRKLSASLLGPQLQLAGRFDAGRKRVSGTVRVTGRNRSGRGCDSRVVTWSARL
jgi:hypothetical protein